MGIATTDLPNVYHPFFRADRSRAREAGTSGGVGLGLTLAKRIVEAHGGTIELVSGTGKGTRAQVSVPVPQATQ
jgi:signal transduction histidine kinase